MGINFGLFSRNLSTGFRIFNSIILFPILFWPLVFFVSIFLFDNPTDSDQTYLLFFGLNSYPVFLVVLAELNARIHRSQKGLSLILPSVFSLMTIVGIGYVCFSIFSSAKIIAGENQKKREAGWLGICETYRVQGDTIFYRDTIISGANSKSIKQLNCDFATDDRRVYSGINAIPRADPNSFQVLDWQWEKDNYHVFYQGTLMPEIDARSFELLQNNYSRDRRNVFYYSKIVVGADPDSFEVDDFTYVASDKNGTYHDGVKK